ncbi:hypothetical protein JRQ81_003434 [Phrynocephalus forsythii]|uniref:C-type lectin domain-containing protein n=1 Tax=Phrynocephalus forsythii TaxID=171643 RepID=A0A9Q0XK72_9SAUR|nr:hypothetical protein JRQ81_003434 [Phrynocephalus forsythii]
MSDHKNNSFLPHQDEQRVETGVLKDRNSSDEGIESSDEVQQRKKRQHRKVPPELKQGVLNDQNSSDEGIESSEEVQPTSPPKWKKRQHRKVPPQIKQVCTKKMPVGIVVLFILIPCLVFTLISIPSKNQMGDAAPLPCSLDWIWYRRRCYYFSVAERNWTSSQNFCFLHNASLAMLTDEEKDFIHLLKGRDSFWIGLRRSPGQPWKWPNGDHATLEVLGDGGDCAYLDNDFQASSSRCSTPLRWMCSKPDASEKRTE